MALHASVINPSGMIAVKMGWLQHSRELQQACMLEYCAPHYDGPRTPAGDERRAEVAREYWKLLQPGPGLPC